MAKTSRRLLKRASRSNTYKFLWTKYYSIFAYCVEDGPRSTQDRPKTAQEAPRKDPERPQRGPKEAPKKPQEASKGPPRGT